MKLPRSVAAAATVAVALTAVGAIAPVAGHGGEAGIDVTPAQAMAGDEVTVLGEDLEPGTPMQLHLLTAEGDVLVARPTADEAGHFAQPLTLPTDLDERVYELRLTNAAGEATSTFVTIIRSGVDRDGAPSSSFDLPGGWLTAGVLGLVGIALLVIALRPGGNRPPAASLPTRKRPVRRGREDRTC